MKFRNIDENNDWTFGSGINNYAQNSDAVRLLVKTRLKEWLNDCFFNLTAGVDYVNRLGSKNQESLLEEDLRNIILQTEGVGKLKSFSFEVNNREFSAQYDIITIYSEEFKDNFEQVV